MATKASVVAALQVALAEANALPPDQTVVAGVGSSTARGAVSGSGATKPGGGGGGVGGGIPPTISSRALNLTRLLAPEFQYAGTDRYGRFQNLMVLVGPTPLRFYITNMRDGGVTAGVSLTHSAYGVSVNGVEWSQRYLRTGSERTFVATVTPPVGASDDWYVATVVCYDSAGQPIASPIDSPTAFWIGVNRNGLLPQCPDVPKMTGNYCWVHPEAATVNVPAQPGVCAWLRMPKAMNEPVARPIAARTFAPFSTKLLYTQFTRTNVTPPVSQDDSEIYRTTYNDAGIATSFNLQKYFPEDWQLAPTRLSATDGPRNIASLLPATDVLLRHGGGFDFSDAGRRGHVDATGAVRTFYGLRHKKLRYSGHDSSPNWYDPPDLADPNVEIVNASSWPASVPMNQRFPWECWGFAFDKRTVGIDLSKPKILVNGVLTPQHATDPSAFFADRFGRIVKVTWKGNANGLNVDAQGNVTDPITGAPVDLLTLPPTIQIWVSNLDDPWGLVCENGVIAVTVRGSHRLSEYSADAPNTLLRHVIDNPNATRFGTVGPRRRFSVAANIDSWSAANAAAARADTIVAPEGLATYVDVAGDRWYVWGSYAQGEVREINSRTLAWRVVCRPFVGFGAKSWFVYLKRDNGVIGTTTFSEAATAAGGWGHPELFWPTPTTASDGTPLTNSPWDWVHATQAKVYCGPGGRTETSGYAMAFDFNFSGDGRMVASSSLCGFDEWTATQGSPTLPDEAKASLGFAYWKSKHYYLRWGWTGFDGSYALPWGENAACDYWLTSIGHVNG